jgi:hypothetical protein
MARPRFLTVGQPRGSSMSARVPEDVPTRQRLLCQPQQQPNAWLHNYDNNTRTYREKDTIRTDHIHITWIYSIMNGNRKNKTLSCIVQSVQTNIVLYGTGCSNKHCPAWYKVFKQTLSCTVQGVQTNTVLYGTGRSNKRCPVWYRVFIAICHSTGYNLRHEYCYMITNKT